MNKFGRQLFAWRMKQQLTLAQVAMMTRVSAATLSNIEGGRVSPQELTKHKISRALPGFEMEASSARSE